jgi:hypothetical protein
MKSIGQVCPDARCPAPATKERRLYVFSKWGSAMRDDLALSKPHQIPTFPFKIVGRSRWRLLRRASRKLLRALRESRARAARRIIFQHRHLIDG